MLKRFNPLDWYNALRCRIVYHPRHLYIRHPDIHGWQWQDRDSIMLCAVFQILVDFVELELPQHSRWCGEDVARWYRWGRYIPFVSWYADARRDAVGGCKHLLWAMSLEDSPSQAHHAGETLALYTWWTVERPARMNPWEQVADLHCGIKELFNGEDADGLKAKYFAELETAGAIEEKFHDEDEVQLIRLMKVRRGLWT